jgi:hypothetical protein
MVALAYLAPFKPFERVSIPSMSHLGTGRVLSCRFIDHPVAGKAWRVSLKLAASGDVVELNAHAVHAA